MARPACCARISTQIAREKGEISRLARVIARRQETGRPIEKYAGQLATVRAGLAMAESNQVEHEALHAAEVA